MNDRLLLIDTATERGIVSFFEQNRLVFHENLPFGLNNSKFLLPKIQEGLRKLGLKPRDLDCIACGIGPGSYTGMRVGAMTAKTLSFALDVPLVGICTLEEFLPVNNGAFAAVIDAKVAGAYVLKGKKKDQAVQYEEGPQVLSIDELKEYLSGLEQLVTPKAERLKKMLDHEDSHWQEKWPDAGRMAHLAIEKYKRGEISRDGSLDLLYLRESH